MAFIAPALPFLAVASTVVSGVLAYQQRQSAAGAMEAQAAAARRAAQQQLQLTNIQIRSEQVREEGEQLAIKDREIRMRRRARQLEQQQLAMMAGRNVIAGYYGSQGAVLGDAADELYQDLEASKLERSYRETESLTRLAGITAGGYERAGALNIQAASALGDARAARTNATVGLLGTAADAFSMWPQEI